MSFIVQRDINPKNLPVRKWYESLARRPLNPSTEAIVMIGGREAVRRRPTTPTETIRVVNGKEASRITVLRPDDTTFVRLNGSDILTISLNSRSRILSGTFEQVLESIRFSR